MAMTHIRLTDARKLIRILGDTRAAADPLEQGRHLVDGMCDLVGADAGWFVECVNQNGKWIPAGMGAGSVLDESLMHYMQQWGREYPINFDMMATSIIANPNATFVQTWQHARQAAPADRLAPFMDLVQTTKVTDMADPVFCLNPQHRFALNLQRIGVKRRPFNTRELALMDLVANELKWLHDTGRLKLSALTRNQPPKSLPPRLSQIFDALLLGESPKQIARRLGLSVHTVREHIQRLYRQLGVEGRDDLMAKFVRK